MNPEPTPIERRVMRRVHLIRALRYAISSGTLSTLGTIVGLWGIGSQVWVARVIENAPKDVLALPQFYTEAFLHTRPLVQLCVLATLIMLWLVAREISRATHILRTV